MAQGLRCGRTWCSYPRSYHVHMLIGLSSLLGSTPSQQRMGQALAAYIDATASVRRSEQLFICHGGRNRGCALSKQRLSHWVVDAIRHAFGVRGRPLPLGVRCHSTRSVSASWAALKGFPLEDICAAASWTSPDTFSRFYRINVATPHPLGVVLLPGSSASGQ